MALAAPLRGNSASARLPTFQRSTAAGSLAASQVLDTLIPAIEAAFTATQPQHSAAQGDLVTVSDYLKHPRGKSSKLNRLMPADLERDVTTEAEIALFECLSETHGEAYFKMHKPWNEKVTELITGGALRIPAPEMLYYKGVSHLKKFGLARQHLRDTLAAASATSGAAVMRQAMEQSGSLDPVQESNQRAPVLHLDQHLAGVAFRAGLHSSIAPHIATSEEHRTGLSMELLQARERMLTTLLSPRHLQRSQQLQQPSSPVIVRQAPQATSPRQLRMAELKRKRNRMQDTNTDR